MDAFGFWLLPGGDSVSACKEEVKCRVRGPVRFRKMLSGAQALRAHHQAFFPPTQQGLSSPSPTVASPRPAEGAQVCQASGWAFLLGCSWAKLHQAGEGEKRQSGRYGSSLQHKRLTGPWCPTIWNWCGSLAHCPGHSWVLACKYSVTPLRHWTPGYVGTWNKVVWRQETPRLGWSICQLKGTGRPANRKHSSPRAWLLRPRPEHSATAHLDQQFSTFPIPWYTYTNS